MTRKEIFELRRGALLSLKALYVGTLHDSTMERILPTQIQAAAALHQACCWEWEDSWNGIDVEGLLMHLNSIETELREAIICQNTDPQMGGIRSAHFTLVNLIAGLQEGNPDEDEDAEEGS